MTALNAPQFTDETAAVAHLEASRWPDGVNCPHCGSVNVHRMGGKTQAGMFLCNDCRDKFTGRTGTVMERSKIPIHKWLLAIHLLAALESSERWEVEGAVRELVRLQSDPHPGLALAAKERLEKLVKTVSSHPRAAPGPAVVSTPAAAERAGARAHAASLDFTAPPMVSAAKPAEVAGAAASTPPAQPAASATRRFPGQSGAEVYASLRPKSVRPPIARAGPASGGLCRSNSAPEPCPGRG